MKFWGGRFKLGGGIVQPKEVAGLDTGIGAGFHTGAVTEIYSVLSETLVDLGLQIVREGPGPMRLWEFSWRLGTRLGMPPMPLGELSDAVKATLSTIDHSRLRVLAPPARGTGAGYVYDAADPSAWPVRTSR